MFSLGQIQFAVFFAITFIIVMIFSYRKDLKLHQQYYKGSIWILFFFLLFIAGLFVVKTLLKD
ncbi:hypothetical protein EQG63_07710 [Flavobacterium amnicola]|jgi:hypothetical protein|uniref:Uncharacterized protein n=1 Tax=Flavobacterium amnicola TaxID=2506422 RepID=A0A4Q1K2Q1_9FLAO|nr:hypothetical protein EQG63_07710 [Flavobacterium amnicola]